MNTHQNMHWEVTTAPAAEPVLLADALAYLEEASGYADDKITDAIEAARADVEEYLNRALITQKITLTLDDWPFNETIHLVRAPFGAITSFSYIDTNGDSQNLVEDTDYRIYSNGGGARLIPIGSWPNVSSLKRENISVVYTVGYGASGASVPTAINTAILMHVDWQYSKGMIPEDNWKRMCARYRNPFDWTINN